MALRRIGMPLLIFGMFILPSVLIYNMIKTNQELKIESDLTLTGQQIKVKMQEYFGIRIRLVGQMARNTSGSAEISEENYVQMGSQFLNWFPEVLAINWVDPNYIIRIVNPYRGNEAAIGKNLAQHPSGIAAIALSRAEKTGGMAHTGVLELLQGGKGVVVYWPVFDDFGRLKGFVNGVFRLQTVIDACLRDIPLRDRYHFSFRQNDLLIFETASYGDPVPSKDLVVQFLNQDWNLKIWPQESYLEQNSPVTSMWVVFLGFVAGLASSFAWLSREQKQAEIAKQRSILISLTEATPDALILFSPAGLPTYKNEKLFSIFSNPVPETLSFQRWKDWLQGHTSQMVDWAIDFKHHAGEFSTHDGKSIEWFSSPIKLDKDRNQGQLFSFRDLSERRVLERELALNQAKFQEIFESANEGILLIQKSQKVIDSANAKAQKIFDSPLEKGTPLSQFMDFNQADLIAFFADLKNLQHAFQEDCTLLNASGEEVYCDISGSTFTLYDESFLILMVRDIQRRKAAEHAQRKLEMKMQHAQKLESLGVLAGGIAHDFNNILAAIVGNADLAEQKYGPETKDFNPIKEIQRAAEKAAQLTKQMLAYSGKGRFANEPILLNDQLREIGSLIRVSLSKNIKIELQLKADLPAIIGDPGQINQVILNLLTNAGDAMADRSGNITITTELVQGAALPQGPMIGSRKECDYCVLRVEDQGVGIPAENLNKIFDPFFSTKFTGRGLGLAAVAGILQNHNALCWIDSQLEKGTRFTVAFPASDAPIKTLAAPNPIRGQKGKILIAEDEPELIQMLTMILENQGYIVLKAINGEDAINMVDDEVDLIILDITMPIVDGREVLRLVRQNHKSLPVLMVSGYSKETLDDILNADPQTQFLQKPYKMNTLLSKVQKMLEEEKATWH